MYVCLLFVRMTTTVLLLFCFPTVYVCLLFFFVFCFASPLFLALFYAAAAASKPQMNKNKLHSDQICTASLPEIFSVFGISFNDLVVSSDTAVHWKPNSHCRRRYRNPPYTFTCTYLNGTLFYANTFMQAQQLKQQQQPKLLSPVSKLTLKTTNKHTPTSANYTNHC